MDRYNERFPEQTRETLINPQIQELGRIAALRQKAVDRSREITAMFGAAAALGGGLIAESAFAHPDIQARSAQSSEPLRVSAAEAGKRLKTLDKKCYEPLEVGQGSKTRTKDLDVPLRTLKVVPLEGMEKFKGRHQRFSWTHPSKETLCGVFASLNDGTFAFPKPTAEGKTRGKYTDPVAYGKPGAVQSLTVYFRRKR